METMKSVLRIIFGFLMIVAGLYLVIYWSQAVWIALKAFIALFVLLVGLAFIFIGFSDMRQD